MEHREYSVLPRNVVELANKRLIVLGLGGSAYINCKEWLVRASVELAFECCLAQFRGAFT